MYLTELRRLTQMVHLDTQKLEMHLLNQVDHLESLNINIKKSLYNVKIFFRKIEIFET